MSLFGAHHRRLCVATALVLAVSWISSPRPARAQDTRTVKEPRIPATCVALGARYAAPGGLLSDVAEAAPDTRRIQEAIDACGAGRAVALRADGDKNVFLSAPLRLRAGVTLLIDAGVALFASRDPRAYDLTPGSCGVVAPTRGKCLPFILADKAPGSAIMGDGAIDGRGGAVLLGGKQTWWDLARAAKIRDQYQSCPRLINAVASDDFTLYRITLRNAANLHVGVERTNGFTAWAVKIKTPRTARNTDGIDPISSRNITITQSWIDTGDDNVALKPGVQGPVEHVTIAHNHFYAGHGMSIGSETSGGASAIEVVDLTLDGTDHGLRIKSDRSRGGLVHGVTYENVCLRNVGNPILIDTRYSNFGGDKIPVYRDIVLRDVRSLTPGGLAFLGFDERNRIGVTLDNVNVMTPTRDLRAAHAEITIGPRRGNLVPVGVDVSSTDKGARAGVPLDCGARFVPFVDASRAPAAAVVAPPEDRTLYVAVSGNGDYYSVQRALDVAPATGGALISVGPGTYREVLTVDKPGIVLRSAAADASKTVIVYDNSAGSTGSTFKAATVRIVGRDFRAENLTFANDFNRTHPQTPQGSQALALLVAGDRAVFRNVRLLGNQDTLYAGSSDCTPPGHDAATCTPTRQYFEGCYIEGNVDFIFGNSLAVFERCEIHSTPHVIGYITAHGKQDDEEQSLFVFNHCKLTAEPGVTHVWLGRPWRSMASVVFLNTEMGAHIEPGGWREWHPGETDYMSSVLYAEYNSSGPGAHPAERDPHTKKLTAAEAAAYQTRKVLGGKDGWNAGWNAGSDPR
jgi:polygalacturonase